MKRILLSITAICAAVSLNAQQNFINGDFESTMTDIGFAYTYSTDGFGFLINGGPETAAFEGTQAAKLVTTNDPTLNTTISWGDDIITGIAQQEYTGAFTNPELTTIDFAYKYSSPGVDKGYIQVTIDDTMAAGAADDVTLFFGFMEFDADVANWTTAQLTMTATGDAGTANSMFIFAVSSQEGYFDATTPTPGTTLWLDGITVGPSSSAGIEEVSAMEVNVYPNPVSTVLNVNTTGVATSVSILSLDGKVISSTDMNGTSVSVNVANLTAGVYFYEIVAEDGSLVRNTFVKK